VSEKSSKTVDIKSSWDRTLSVLRAELGEATFRSWFKHIEFGELSEKKLLLYVPTKFMKDWIHTHYSDRILAILKNDNIPVSSIIFELQKFKVSKDNEDSNAQKTVKKSKPAASSKFVTNENGDHNSMLGAPLDPNLSFENLLKLAMNYLEKDISNLAG